MAAVGPRKLVLDLCGGTGAWSAPYREAPGGEYEVELVTLPGCDVREYRVPAGAVVHGVLAAPPCTEFAGSGARWWAGKQRDNPGLLEEALEVFDACLRVIEEAKERGGLKWWALENPVGRLGGKHGLRREVLGEPRLVFDPCDYGDPYRKRTLVWGEFELPQVARVEPQGERPGQPNAWYSRVGGKGAKTKEWRSATPPGFARAFFEANG